MLVIWVRGYYRLKNIEYIHGLNFADLEKIKANYEITYNPLNHIIIGILSHAPAPLTML